jgi:hypothetical protein
LGPLPPRRVIIERLPQIPPNPQSVIIERWLPYKQQVRRVILDKSTTDTEEDEEGEGGVNRSSDELSGDSTEQQLKNLIIQWEDPSIVIKRQIKDIGVVRTNPNDYIRIHGDSLKRAEDIPQYLRELRSTISPLPIAADLTEKQRNLPQLEGDIKALSLVNLEEEGLADYSTIVEQFSKTKKQNEDTNDTKSRIETLISDNKNKCVEGKLVRNDAETMIEEVLKIHQILNDDKVKHLNALNSIIDQNGLIEFDDLKNRIIYQIVNKLI